MGELQEGRKATDLVLKEAKAELELTEDKLKVTEDELKVTEDKLKVTEDELKVTEDKLKVTEDELLEVKGDLGVALVTAPAYYYALAREVALESSRQSLETKILKDLESKFSISSLPTFLCQTRNDMVHYSRQETTIDQLLVEVNNAKLSLHKILPRYEALRGILKDACIAFDMAAVLLGVHDTTTDVKVEG
eukprot:gene36291-44026_t